MLRRSKAKIYRARKEYACEECIRIHQGMDGFNAIQPGDTYTRVTLFGETEFGPYVGHHRVCSKH